MIEWLLIQLGVKVRWIMKKETTQITLIVSSCMKQWGLDEVAKFWEEGYRVIKGPK